MDHSWITFVRNHSKWFLHYLGICFENQTECDFDFTFKLFQFIVVSNQHETIPNRKQIKCKVYF